MVGVTVNSVRSNALVVFAFYISSSYSLNIGQVTGDLKRLNPVVYKKHSPNSPVFINIKSENKPLKGYIQRLSDKPPPMKRSEPALPGVQSSPKFTRSIMAASIPKLPYVPFFLPMIPKTPILPFFPNWLPAPTGNSLPMMPPMVNLNNRVNPADPKNTQVLEKLIELKQRGSLSTAEYNRFKDLLLKK